MELCGNVTGSVSDKLVVKLSVKLIKILEGKWKSLSRVWLFVTLWIVTRQAPLSMEFSRQEYWSGLPFPSSGDLLHPGIEPRSLTLQADYFPFEPPGKLWMQIREANSG